jgi:hypothetical protein
MNGVDSAGFSAELLPAKRVWPWMANLGLTEAIADILRHFDSL